MLFLFAQAQSKALALGASRLRATRSTQVALIRQDEALHMVKRERWTEDDIDALSPEEPAAFDRKSGMLLDDQNKFRNSVAKELSAFANTGGGSLIIGVADDGTPDGLEPMVGKTRVRDWIEQVVPHLLDYALSDFRVHTVIKREDGTSRIPEGKEVIVIDVGDSALAPHQSIRDHTYYHRQGGRAVPARHFYLELLRQRLTNPSLIFRLNQLEPLHLAEHDGGLFLELNLKFEIENIGHAAAQNWQLHARQITVPDEHNDDFFFSNFPINRSRNSGIVLERAILPGCFFNETKTVGFQLRPAIRTEEALRHTIETFLGGTVVSFRLATENSPGELTPIPFQPVLDTDAIIAAARKHCRSFFSPE